MEPQTHTTSPKRRRRKKGINARPLICIRSEHYDKNGQIKRHGRKFSHDVSTQTNVQILHPSILFNTNGDQTSQLKTEYKSPTEDKIEEAVQKVNDVYCKGERLESDFKISINRSPTSTRKISIHEQKNYKDMLQGPSSFSVHSPFSIRFVPVLPTSPETTTKSSSNFNVPICSDELERFLRAKESTC